jgi:hypothetical protein
VLSKEGIHSSLVCFPSIHLFCISRLTLFLRISLWHEFRVVFHNREHALLSLAVQTWATQERDSCEASLGTWNALVESVEAMPYE